MWEQKNYTTKQPTRMSNMGSGATINQPNTQSIEHGEIEGKRDLEPIT